MKALGCFFKTIECLFNVSIIALFGGVDYMHISINANRVGIVDFFLSFDIIKARFNV